MMFLNPVVRFMLLSPLEVASLFRFILMYKGQVMEYKLTSNQEHVYRRSTSLVLLFLLLFYKPAQINGLLLISFHI